MNRGGWFRWRRCRRRLRLGPYVSNQRGEYRKKYEGDFWGVKLHKLPSAITATLSGQTLNFRAECLGAYEAANSCSALLKRCSHVAVRRRVSARTQEKGDPCDYWEEAVGVGKAACIANNARSPDGPQGRCYTCNSSPPCGFPMNRGLSRVFLESGRQVKG